MLDLPPGPCTDLVTAFAVFAGAPLHVHNPYLRAKLVEALEVRSRRAVSTERVEC